jgi:magnesium chelatase family protein
VRTVAFHGVEVIEVETQVTIGSGLPAFTVIGLPDKAVAESREVAAFDRRSSPFGSPSTHVTSEKVRPASSYSGEMRVGALAQIK